MVNGQMENDDEFFDLIPDDNVYLGLVLTARQQELIDHYSLHESKESAIRTVEKMIHDGSFEYWAKRNGV